MLLTTKDENNKYAVLDKVLDDSMFLQFSSYFNSLDFAFRSMTGWQKVWKVSDGQVLAGPPYYNSKAPFGVMMDVLNTVIGALAEQHLQSIVGKKNEDWDDFFLTPYIYPCNTKISWHNDYGYTAAAIFYTHKIWNPGWGGELFVAKTSVEEEAKNANFDSSDRNSINPILNQFGMGTYIAPLPNRLVFTKGGVWHSINRVDQSAGDAMRCSIVAFFTKGKK